MDVKIINVDLPSEHVLYNVALQENSEIWIHAAVIQRILNL